MIVKLAKDVAGSPQFQLSIYALILLNAVVMGFETSSFYNNLYGEWFNLFFYISQIIFIVEIALRITTYWPRLFYFFRDSRNIFDFCVVAISLIPAAGSLAFIARLGRVLRALRLFSGSARMRIFLRNFDDSLGVLAYSVVVFALIMYVFALVGYYSFGESDMANWGDIPATMATLSGWLTSLGDAEFLGRASLWGWLYHFAFYFLTLGVITNLFAATARIHIFSEEPNDDQFLEGPEDTIGTSQRAREISERIAQIEVQLRKLRGAFDECAK